MSHEERDTVLHFWNAGVYWMTFFYFGAGFWYASLAAVLIFLCTQWDYGHGRRAIYILGLACLLTTMGVAGGLVPSPHWVTH